MKRNSYLFDFISSNADKFQNTKSFIVANMVTDVQEKTIEFRLGDDRLIVEKPSEEEIEQMTKIGIDYEIESTSIAIREFMLFIPVEIRLGGIVVEDVQSLFWNFEEQATYELEIYSLVDQAVYVRENVFFDNDRLYAVSTKLDEYAELLDRLIVQEYQKKIANV